MSELSWEVPDTLKIFALPETNRLLAPENGWLEDDSFPFWGKFGLFSGAFAVSFREGNGIS